MKKFFTFFLCILLGITLLSCSKGSSEANESSKAPELPEANEDVGFAIHYNKTTMIGNKYRWNLWLWENGKNGADYQFNETDSYGLVARYKFSQFSSNIKNNGLGFIIKENKAWAESPAKDTDSDRFIDFNKLERDIYGYYNIYLKNGDKAIYINANGDVNEMINYFCLLYNQSLGYQMKFRTNKKFDSYEIVLGKELIFSNTIGTDKIYSQTTNEIVFNLGDELPNISDQYTLNVNFGSKTLSATADISYLYSTPKFDERYTYDGELGAIYTKENTTFRVWSPISSLIKLRIYDVGTPKSLGGNDEYKEYNMTKGAKGTWEYTITGDYEGKYYTYIVNNSTYKNKEIVDPYAKSTGLNGLRGMIVDFSKTNPEGWDEIKIHNYKSTELTVYETHIADLTASSTWGGSSENSKLYKGFYEAGTTYTEKNVTVATGFDHIKELGVNAVQILPFFDQANDERIGYRTFNWGYNPLNYNSLEGIYSSDPTNGYTKIIEFKQLVKEYNKAGINIIMDVVYNHVNGLEQSNFDVLMPKYYFRYTSSGPSNGSGCGNETASEMPMFRKFMIDSTEFWASEYKLGGFRFDLMGIHDIETMNQLTKNLHNNIDSSIIVYGEPWAGGDIALSSQYQAAKQAAMDYFDEYGCFNDKMRDALIKGGLNSDSSKGWITNNSNVSSADVNNIKSGLKGLILTTNSKIEPEKCINYVTCHDNYTLYDRIKAAGISDEETIKKMAILANSIVFTSQGTSFMLAGEEFLRTKNGNSNSYNASYDINALDYSLKIKNIDVFNNFKKLIAIKQTIGLFDKNGIECQTIDIKTNEDGSLIYYDIINEKTNVSYRITYSNGVSTSTKNIDFTGYTLYLDTLSKEDLVLNDNTELEEYQTIIAYKAIE
ncbi:MAG: type I pullulanase [Anaeroplasma sp.]